jgi:hypothetical protein
MAEWNNNNQLDRELRHCKTRAFGARLFARYPLHASNAAVWEDVARAWDDLAALKQHIAETDARSARTAARLSAHFELQR